MPPSIRPLAAALAAAATLALAPTAHADGDPASDVLIQQDVFYGSAVDLTAKPAAQLPALLAQSRRKGYEIRVAAITRVEDLGIATDLWKAPNRYAQYLGLELGGAYHGRTLVVMPNGYAIFHFGHSATREQRLLDTLPPASRTEAFLPGAIDAVRRLAAAQGVKLSVPDVEVPPGGVQPIQAGHVPVPTTTTAPGATVTPRPGPARAPVAAKSSGGAWMFAIPIVAFVLVAVAAIARSRLRERA